MYSESQGAGKQKMPHLVQQDTATVGAQLRKQEVV